MRRDAAARRQKRARRKGDDMGLSRIVLVAIGLVAAAAQASAQPAHTYRGYLNPADAEMEQKKQRGAKDLRWNHSCPIYYPARLIGAACQGRDAIDIPGAPGGACCARLTAEEQREEDCRNKLNSFVRNAKGVSGRGSLRQRSAAATSYEDLRSSCPREMAEIASASGRALPVRSAAATPRASAAIAESLGRRPGTERRPDYVQTPGGRDETAEYVFEILSFALGAASVVAANYQPRIGGSYGTRNPGRAPSAGAYVRDRKSVV